MTMQTSVYSSTLKHLIEAKSFPRTLLVVSLQTSGSKIMLVGSFYCTALKKSWLTARGRLRLKVVLASNGAQRACGGTVDAVVQMALTELTRPICRSILHVQGSVEEGKHRYRWGWVQMFTQETLSSGKQHWIHCYIHIEQQHMIIYKVIDAVFTNSIKSNDSSEFGIDLPHRAPSWPSNAFKKHTQTELIPQSLTEKCFE